MNVRDRIIGAAWDHPAVAAVILALAAGSVLTVALRAVCRSRA